MKTEKRTPGDYVVSTWSGGKTTQIVIYPPQSVYADRDFLFRISSATVETEHSDFTPLPAYDRVILTLQGDLTLTHNGGGPILLHPLHPHPFGGEEHTESDGKVTDFNLMTRKGAAEGKVECLCRSVVTAKEGFHLFYAAENSVLSAEGKEYLLEKGESLYLTLSAGESATVGVKGSVVYAAVKEIHKEVM